MGEYGESGPSRLLPQYVDFRGSRGTLCQIIVLTLCSQMIVGTVAIRGAHLQLEPPALQEFEDAYEMFNSAAQSNLRAARAIVRDSNS